MCVPREEFFLYNWFERVSFSKIFGADRSSLHWPVQKIMSKRRICVILNKYILSSLIYTEI